MNDFEQKLSRQPVKKIPGEWRGEILAAANAALRPPPRTSFLATFNAQLSTIFWPHPKAWAGLAAVWIFIIAVNFSMRDPSPRMAEKSAPPSPEVIVELRKQQILLAELIGPRESRDADRPRIFTPKPRGERVEFLAA
jgi:hypothetical protein